MAQRRTTTILLGGLLAVGVTACHGPPHNGGGGGFCFDTQEGSDPTALGGTTFSRQSTRCIEPDNDEDVYTVNPNADGVLFVTCTTDEEDLVHVEIDPSTGATVDFACEPGGETRSVPLDSTDTAEITFSEGTAGTTGEGESYRLTIEFVQSPV